MFVRAVGTGVSLHNASLTGWFLGLDVANMGSGFANITATGPVTGTSIDGIRIVNGQLNLGVGGDAGATTITATGTIVGGIGNGIFAAQAKLQRCKSPCIPGLGGQLIDRQSGAAERRHRRHCRHRRRRRRDQCVGDGPGQHHLGLRHRGDQWRDDPFAGRCPDL
jgi:hypothetical protein